jgi:DNA-binding transcriptional LysR family regulator
MVIRHPVTDAAIGKRMARRDWYLRAGFKMRHLRMLVLLDQHRQTSKVAAVLNVTQPAVSKALADLEHGLGMTLFDRHARGLDPTPLGDCLIRCARAMLGDLADTAEGLDALSRGVMKTIRVGALPASAASLIPACLARIKELAPSTAVFVREATMDSLVSELRSGGIELVVGVLSDRQSYRDLEEEVLFADQTTFVVRRDHPLSPLDSIDLPMLAEYPWVLPPTQSLLGESLREWFDECGMPRPTNVIETLSVSVIRRYLAVSDAIATVPASIASEPHWAEDFHVLPLTPPALVRPVGMSWYRDRPLTPGAQLFMTCMRSIVEQSSNGVI